MLGFAELLNFETFSGDGARCTHDEASLQAAGAPDHPRPYLSEDL
jgi:hypothetical protein